MDTQPISANNVVTELSPPVDNINVKLSGKSRKQIKKKKTDDDKQWSTDEVEMLIRLWQENEELYRVDHPQYLDRGRKSLVLSQIAEQLSTSVVEVQNKMRGLQTYYGQLRRASKGHSGSAMKKKIRWAFYDSMNFLNAGNPEPNVCVGNIESMVDETTPDPSTTPQAFQRIPAKRRRPQENAPSVNTALLERAVNAFEKDSSGSSKSLTEDQLFAQMVGVKLAKISEGDDKEDIKLDILTSLSNLLKKQKRENNN